MELPSSKDWIILIIGLILSIIATPIATFLKEKIWVLIILGVLLPLNVAYLVSKPLGSSNSWALFILIFMVACASGLTIFHNLPIEWKIKPATIVTKIRGWLDEEQYSVTVKPDRNRRFSLDVGDSRSDMGLTIFNPVVRPSSLVMLVSASTFDKNDLNKIIKNDEDNRKLFLNRLTIEITKIDVGVDTHQFLDKNTILFTTAFYFTDKTTKLDLVHEITKIMRALQLASKFFAVECSKST